MTSTHTDAIADAAAPAALTDPAAVVQSLYAAFGRGDLEAVLDVIDPEVDWSIEVDAPGGELVPMFRNGTGHTAVRHYFDGVAELEFHVFEPRAFHVDGDVVIVELVLEMTHRRTGRHARIDEIHRFVIRDGRVVHYRPFCDTAAFIHLFGG